MDNYYIIKKYPSARRLYDTVKKTFIIHDDIMNIVMQGHNIKVINSKNADEDTTYPALVYGLFELERKTIRQGDVELLTRIIRSKHGTFTGYIKELEAHYYPPLE